MQVYYCYAYFNIFLYVSHGLKGNKLRREFAIRIVLLSLPRVDLSCSINPSK